MHVWPHMRKTVSGSPSLSDRFTCWGHPPIPLGHDKHAAAHSKNASYFSDFLKQGYIVSESSNRNRIFKLKA